MDKNGKVHIGARPEHLTLLTRARELTGHSTDPDAVRAALNLLVDAANASGVTGPISSCRLKSIVMRQ